jgi:DNA-binding transcriptional MerR regulator
MKARYLMEPTMNIGAAARLLGVKPQTLQMWDRKGKLKPYRSVTNRRHYTEAQLREFLQLSDPTNPPAKAVK